MDGLKYPVASDEDLVDFFNNNFLMNISYDAFTKPTKELVCSIYDKFLYDFGIEYRIPQLNAVHTDNVAMHSVSFPYINLQQAIAGLLRKVGFSEFTFNDLSKPQRRRNQIIFSQLAGLWTRFFEVQETWKSIAEEHEMLARKKNEIRKRIEAKKKSCEEKLLAASQLERDVPRLEIELAKAAEGFAGEKAKSTSLKSSQEKVKREFTQSKEQIAEWVQRIAMTKEECARNESQLVKSPEKVFAATSRKEKLRDEVRAERQAISKQLLERKAEYNALKEELEDYKPITKVLDEFESHLANLKSSCQNGIQMEEEEISAREMKISQLDIQIDRVKDICEGVVKQKSTASKSHEQRMATLKDMIAEIELTISNIEKEKSTNAETSSTIEHSLLQQLHKLRREFEENNKKFETTNLEEEMAFTNIMDSFIPRIEKVLSSANNPM